MADPRPMQEKLIEEFTRNYLEKVFYFCLKRCGSESDAEDLSQDIAISVITQLRKGTVPESFSAWVWKISRNLYGKWAQAKHDKLTQETGTDVSELDVANEDIDALDETIKREQLSLLRRELAFIRKDYREIVVAHYIENRRLRDIAAGLSLSTDTVKQRLFRARNILKEGMNMAREFGQRSYKPEELHFMSTGSQPSGLPWNAVERLIPINILCEANNNPSTIEELSIELGIAMPYMEQEVSILEESELLKKTDDGKYVTAFFIAPRECQQEFNMLCSDFIDRNYKAIWELAGFAVEEASKHGALDGCITREDAHMYFAFNLEHHLVMFPINDNTYEKFKRRDGGNWGFIGYENDAAVRPRIAMFSNNQGFNVQSYQRDGDGHNWLPLTNATSPAIKELAANGWKSDGISPTAIKHLKTLMNEPATVKDMGGGIWKPDMLVFDEESKKAVYGRVEATDEYKRLAQEEKELFAKEMKIIEKYIYPLFRDDADFYASMLSFDCRGLLYTDIVNNGLYTGESKAFYAVTI